MSEMVIQYVIIKDHWIMDSSDASWILIANNILR